MPSQKTLKRYFYEWDCFVRWCRRTSHPQLPSTPQAVATYLSHFPTYSSAICASAAITYAHRLAHLRSPVRNPLVYATKRQLALRENLKWPPVRFKRPSRPAKPLANPLANPTPHPDKEYDPWQNPVNQ